MMMAEQAHNGQLAQRHDGVEAMDAAQDPNIIGVHTYGGQYIQYNIFGNLFEVSSKYVPPIRPIGRGAYGIVCSAINTETEEEIAIKKIANAFDNRIDAKRTLREIKLLRHMDHENFWGDRYECAGVALGQSSVRKDHLEEEAGRTAVDSCGTTVGTGGSVSVEQVIAIRDIIRTPDRRHFNDVYIVYELMDTDLHQIIRSHQELSEDHCQYFLYQLLRGLKYIHSARVLHRDLKPSNLLLNANCDLKICDFGLARTMQEADFMTEYVVTRWYRAPELLLNCNDYTAAIDVWSVGCIFMELLNRQPLFPGRDYVQQLQLITETLGSPDDAEIRFLHNPEARRFLRSLPPYRRRPLATRFPDMAPMALDLISRMLVFDPAQRITVEDALNHPYLASLHDINDEPVCHAEFPLDFELPHLTEDQIRDLIYEESCLYNPKQ